MIERYQDRDIRILWSKTYKYGLWEKIELLYLNAMMKEEPEFDEAILTPFVRCQESIARFEKTTKHEFVAFLQELSNRLEIFKSKKVLKYLHYGLTSSDVIDTAMSLQIKSSIQIIKNKLEATLMVATELTNSTSNINTIGRTHGKHAEEISLSSRFELFEVELMNGLNLLEESEKHLYGKLTGPVGSSSFVNIKAAQKTLKELGLTAAPITTQIIPRFYYTDVMYACIMIMSALERMATQIRLLSIDEINEMQEGFTEGQTGSSAMPHKQNPIISENICGLARLAKRNFQTALDNNNLWWERDISHSSVERIIWPETFHLTAHALVKMTNLLKNLNINTTSIAKNLNNSSHQSHKELLEGSIESSRFQAYKDVQHKYIKHKV